VFSAAFTLEGAETASDRSPVKADFVVATGGNDTNPGTPDKPFATVARARDAVRDKIAAGLQADVLVMIRGGVYRLTETLVFGPQDSGTQEHSITYAAYPGEKVVLSGGRIITGWKQGQGNIWTAQVDGAKDGRWYFRQLFVNGRRAIRARTPDADEEPPYWRIKSSSLEGWGGIRDNTQPITLSVTQPIKAWNNLSDVEFVWGYNHNGFRKCLSTADETVQQFTLPPPYPLLLPGQYGGGYYQCYPKVRSACHFENALEMLDKHGEWYLDRQSGVLSYMPRQGEDMTRAEVVAPVVHNTLLSLAGQPDRPVRHLRFKRIHVQHVDRPLTDGGFFTVWNCATHRFKPDGKTLDRNVWMDSAVQMQHARGCEFLDGGVAHVEGAAVTLRDGTANIIVEGNVIHDIGANGIGAGSECRWKNYANDFIGPSPQDGEYRGYRIANNHVYDCGMVHYGAAGIEINTTQDSVVAHNLVHDIGYCGLIVYGDMEKDRAFAQDNLVENNHVHDVSKAMTDGAGIYCMLPQTGGGCTIRNNLVHDIHVNPANNVNNENRHKITFGLYLDIICKNYHVFNNVVYGAASGKPFFLLRTELSDNRHADNLFQIEGTPPRAFLEAMESFAGLEPAYRRALLKSDAPVYERFDLKAAEPEAGWSGYQFHCDKAGKGVVQVFRNAGAKATAARFALRGLNPGASYALEVSTSAIVSGGNDDDKKRTAGEIAANKALRTGKQTFPVIEPPHRLPAAESASRKTGKELMEEGIPLDLPQPAVAWIAYRINAK
jgi:hypothetical protein